jgi:hypothetical protein
MLGLASVKGIAGFNNRGPTGAETHGLVAKSNSLQTEEAG